MKITENNCEEYFLLYIDDELTSAERNAVAAFIHTNPQYAATLDGLMQTKLGNEEGIGFINKNSLYKTEEREIGIDNYESYFLLYTDNELSETEKTNTERFVLQHPHLQSEFTLLQQTKLPVENIIFNGKEKLYRKEKNRRVIPFYLTRMAVAAAVITLLALSWQFYESGHNVVDKITAKTTEPKHQVNKDVFINKLPVSDKNKVEPDHQIPLIVVQQKKIKLPVNKPDQSIVTVKTSSKKDDASKVIITDLPQLATTQTILEPTETAMQKQHMVDAEKPVETLKLLDEGNSDESNAQSTSALVVTDNNIAQPAVYKELNTEEENHTLYVGDFQLNKAKVNGFLKSASHLLGNHSKSNSE